jgi:hypothetical protein
MNLKRIKLDAVLRIKDTSNQEFTRYVSSNKKKFFLQIKRIFFAKEMKRKK